MKVYKEFYKGYVIKQLGEQIKIYDKNAHNVCNLDGLNIHAAKIKIDELIKNSTSEEELEA